MTENGKGDEIKELSESRGQFHISLTELRSGEITLSKGCIKKGHGIVRPMEDSVCTVRIENVLFEEGDHVIRNEVQKIHIGERDTDVDDVVDKCLRSMTEGEISTFVSVSQSEGTDLENGGGTSKMEGADKSKSESGPCKLEADLSKIETVPSQLQPDPSKTGPDPSKTRQNPSKTRPDPSKIDLKIELISVDKPGFQTWQLSPEEKLTKVLSLKERGNSLYRSGDICLAFSRYRKAIKVLISMLPESSIPEDSLIDFTQARCHCYLNLAACQVKSKKWQYVVENCTKVLKIQPNNVKALYRRGYAYQQTEDFNSAKLDLQRCLKQEPKNKSVLIALQEIALKANEKSDSSLDAHVNEN
ncbi:peptidyl-prolyl cis-trans isomerase FKBP4-like [Liolophura sinensis]|uniref:peptidyl-prolyl cis-trans isomerase FKBP4-like n=1 Tax=Liolophura sinensis TaxID=3198878 RepID=UPI0031584473